MERELHRKIEDLKRDLARLGVEWPTGPGADIILMELLIKEFRATARAPTVYLRVAKGMRNLFPLTVAWAKMTEGERESWIKETGKAVRRLEREEQRSVTSFNPGTPRAIYVPPEDPAPHDDAIDAISHLLRGRRRSATQPADGEAEDDELPPF